MIRAYQTQPSEVIATPITSVNTERITSVMIGKPSGAGGQFTPLMHGEALHGEGAPRHHVVIAQAQPRWRQRAYRVETLPEVLPELAGAGDVFISQGRFWGYRREVAQLAGISALWSDLDCHNVPRLRGMHPLGVLQEALALLEQAKVPQPSLAIFTGRGLAPLWLHSAVPRAALPRWNACQRRIFETLKPLGADAGAKDAARVLRLAGSVNRKSGMVVEALRPPGEVWAFDDLADEVLPLTREELAEVRDLRIQRARRGPERRLWTPGDGLTVATLWEARLSDLQLLLRLRWDAEELPPGQRDKWLFVAGCGMSWLAADPGVMRRELYSLAREVGGWPEGETASRLHAVVRRATMAKDGEKVAYRGAEVDPRYRISTSTIQESLEITAAEERHMSTLISPTEKARRRTEKARASGVIAREEYVGRAARRRREASRRAAEGESFKQIAASLGVSVHTVRSYVYGRR